MSLRVLFVHNFYQQRGGEDAVVESEMALLRSYGHEVELYSRHNDELERTGMVAAGFGTIWSRRTSAEIAERVQRFKPDLIHAHNTFPLVSPSVYWAAHRFGLPIVQTLHNFRMLCPQAMLLRAERPCEDCVGKIPWRSVTHGCYRGSSLNSAVVASMVQAHRVLGTYDTKVTRYIALTEFARAKFVAGGIPARKLVVKPNFVAPVEPQGGNARDGFLFVGRLSAEKGIAVLAQAMMQSGATLDVIGTGPQANHFEGAERVTLQGQRDARAVRKAMFQSSALVIPSICYENFPRTLVEAFSCRLPVIASRLGAMAELVQDGVTGLLFEPGSSPALARTLNWALEHPDDMRRMGEAAYDEYQRRYTPAANYSATMSIYADLTVEAARR